MRPSSSARRYAEAAFTIARGSRDVAGWLGDLETARATLQDPRLIRYFRDPNAPREQKLETINKLFPGIRPEVRNLLRILAIRSRLGLLPSIESEMTQLDREARGVAEATVIVAREIDGAERDEIARRLSAAMRKTVEVRTRIDPSIIGGVVVRIDDRLVDASVAGRLERLRHELAT